MRRGIAWVFAAAVGCSFDSAGGGMAASLGDSAGTDQASESQSSSETSQQSASGSGTSASTTSDTTTDPESTSRGSDPTTGVTATASATGTTGIPTTGDPSPTTGPVSTDSTSSGSAGSTSNAEGSSEGGTQTNTWLPCPNGPNDCNDGETCVQLDDFEENLVASWCAAPCTATPECPQAPPGGNAILQCSTAVELCSLNCAGGATCPTEMTCYEIWTGVGYIYRCAWPV